MRCTLILACGIVAVMSPSLPADSILNQYAPNGAQMNTQVRVGYLAPGTPLPPFFIFGPSGSDNDNIAVDPTSGPVVNVVSSSVAGVTPPLSSAGAKDVINASVTQTYELGAPFPGASLSFDQLSFNLTGSASALDAQISPGNPLDAYVEIKASIFFFLDSLLGAGVVGSMAFPAIRPLQAHELYLFQSVMEESLPVFFHYAGEADESFNLSTGHFYTIQLEYAMLVPYGVDPPFHISIINPFSSPVNPALPEPSGAALMLLSAAAIRKRKRIAA